ncbi:hypothetical protein Ccrd_017165 [Cynara cardunculus var. scolymus]|uniref:Uncharacterized protein n=1 Tax=Cynara cardunculus var. scolymus TaxID=59895 RepID=A0A124SFW6_CYNCS|nr:hypothetical protein Ccrd_017165 [Cynara cardunculus var. scolymus]
MWRSYRLQKTKKESKFSDTAENPLDVEDESNEVAILNVETICKGPPKSREDSKDDDNFEVQDQNIRKKVKSVKGDTKGREDNVKDGIPAKLGYYVVDSFDSQNMLIELENGVILITVKKIHEMIGATIGGAPLDSLVNDNCGCPYFCLSKMDDFNVVGKELCSGSSYSNDDSRGFSQDCFLEDNFFESISDNDEEDHFVLPAQGVTGSPCGDGVRIPSVPSEFQPVVGSIFASLEDGIEMYRMYADIAGFDIRLST